MLTLVLLALTSSAGAARAGTVSVTDALDGWSGGAALLPAPGETYVEEGSVTVTASAEDVVFDAAAGDLVRAGAAALQVRYQVRRPDGTWSPTFGQGLASTAWVDADVSGTRTYLVRATITSTISSTTLAGGYTASLTITLVQS